MYESIEFASKAHLSNILCTLITLIFLLFIVNNHSYHELYCLLTHGDLLCAADITRTTPAPPSRATSLRFSRHLAPAVVLIFFPAQVASWL